MARSSPKVSYAHFRTERISLTAAMPLLAIRTCRETVVSQGRRIPRVLGQTHIADDSVAVVASHEVLHFRGGGIVKLVAADEMASQGVLLGVGRLAINDGNRHAIRGALTVLFAHGCCRDG
jgi:hypothetical protein